MNIANGHMKSTHRCLNHQKNANHNIDVYHSYPFRIADIKRIQVSNVEEWRCGEETPQPLVEMLVDLYTSGKWYSVPLKLNMDYPMINNSTLG